jgi:hypothetical protein
MPAEQFSILIMCVLMFLAGTVAAIAGFVYVRTNERHGGFVCLVFAITTLAIGGDVYDAVRSLSP